MTPTQVDTCDQLVPPLVVFQVSRPPTIQVAPPEEGSISQARAYHPWPLAHPAVGCPPVDAQLAPPSVDLYIVGTW